MTMIMTMRRLGFERTEQISVSVEFRPLFSESWTSTDYGSLEENEGDSRDVGAINIRNGNAVERKSSVSTNLKGIAIYNFKPKVEQLLSKVAVFA